MKSPARLALFVIVAAVVVLAACAPAATPTPESYYNQSDQFAAPAATGAPIMRDVIGAPAVSAEKVAVDSGGGNAVIETGSANTTLPDVPQPQSDRKIIKNADLKLQVEETDTAIDRSTQIVGDVGGYIISSRVWYQDTNGKSYKYATISMGVPVEQFEPAMRRLRGLALKVLDENASGEDVTDQYVDLQSQLGNLEATRDRIRTFLAQAKTVDEALQVNQQLTEVEGQIEQVKGKINYLSGRSAFSTITINLEPKLPEITPTPTPSPTPTATPTVWNPGTTLGAAQTTVVSAYQGIIEMLIWLLVVFVPLLLPPALIIWAIWKFVTRKGNKPSAGG